MAREYVLKNIDPTASPPAPAIAYEHELNEAQREAAMFLEGPLLVVAGAGTGKTRTLVYRVARLIERGIDPGSILLLTFTRRAAEEMLQRASLLTDSRCERIAGGTFHSFGNMVLRQYGQLMGLAPGFTIMDRSDSQDVIQVLRAQMGLDVREKRFPRKQTISEIQSLARNKQVPLPELVEREYSHLADFLEELVTIAERYQVYKREKSLLDYDDLLTHLKDLLDSQEDLRHRLSERFRFIMVDEYQDTNRLQSDIIRGLACTHDNVMAVGDDAQSIYSFRGANFRNIMDFPTSFRERRSFPWRRTTAAPNRFCDSPTRSSPGRRSATRRTSTAARAKVGHRSWYKRRASTPSLASCASAYWSCGRRAFPCGTWRCCSARASTPSISRSS